MTGYDEERMVWTFKTTDTKGGEIVTYEVDDSHVPDEVRIRRSNLPLSPVLKAEHESAVFAHDELSIDGKPT